MTAESLYPTLCPKCGEPLLLGNTGLICTNCTTRVIPVRREDRHQFHPSCHLHQPPLRSQQPPNLDAPFRLPRKRNYRLKGDPP